MQQYPAPTGSGTAASTAASFELDRSQRRERRLRLCEVLGVGLLIVCVLYIFGLVDLAVDASEGDTAQGSIVNRVFWLAAFAVGVGILALKLPLTVRVLRTAWPSLLILGWFGMTTLWAAYPDVAMRRVLAIAVVYVAALGMAVGLRSPRSLQIASLAALGTLLIANLLSLAAPSYSQTELGMEGIHMHKNIAGLVAVIAFVGVVFALPRLRAPTLKIATAILALWALAFLYLTQSKTNLGILLAIVALTPLYYFWLHGSRIRPVHLNILVAIGSVAVFAAGAVGFSLTEAGRLVFGDLTFTNRTLIWNAVIEKIAASPQVGFGFGSIWDVGAEYNPFGGPRYEFWNNPDIINQAHNGYLDLLLQGGVIALILALFVALRALWLSSMLASDAAVPASHRYAFCMLHAFVVAYLLNNLLESSLFFPSSSRSYFFLIIITQLDRWKAEFDVYRASTRHLAHAPAPS